MIKYSIVVSAYNAELFIREMIESVYLQTYNNWELIIIDDGSTDSTGKICDEYKNLQVKVFHNENMGQIAARVEGIMQATGDYTLVVDADDRLHLNCLEVLNSILERHEYDCVAFPYSLCDKNLNYINDTVAPEKKGKISKAEFLYWIIGTLNHPLYNKAVKTTKIQAGAKETITDKVKINGDYALIIAIACNTEDIYYHDEPLYDYRVLESSISHKRDFQQVLDTDIVSQSVVSILDKHGLLDDKIERLIYIEYLCMIEWLISELNTERFIKNTEMKSIHKSAFYVKSISYETKDNVGKMKWLVLKALRRYGFISAIMVNLFIRVINKFRAIKQRICYLIRKQG